MNRSLAYSLASLALLAASASAANRRAAPPAAPSSRAAKPAAPALPGAAKAAAPQAARAAGQVQPAKDASAGLWDAVDRQLEGLTEGLQGEGAPLTTAAGQDALYSNSEAGRGGAGVDARPARDFSQMSGTTVSRIPARSTLLMHGRLGDKRLRVRVERRGPGLRRPRFEASIYASRPHLAKDKPMDAAELATLAEGLRAALARADLADRGLHEEMLAAAEQTLAGRSNLSAYSDGKKRGAAPAPAAETPSELAYVADAPNRVGKASFELAEKRGLDSAKLDAGDLVRLAADSLGAGTAAAPSEAARAAAETVSRGYVRLMELMAAAAGNDFETAGDLFERLWLPAVMAEMPKLPSAAAMAARMDAAVAEAEASSRDGSLEKAAVVHRLVRLEQAGSMSGKQLSPSALKTLAAALSWLVERPEIPAGLRAMLRADAELAAMILDLRDLMGDAAAKKPALPAIEAAQRLSAKLK